MADNEELKRIINILQESLSKEIRESLRDELDQREAGDTAFIQSREVEVGLKFEAFGTHSICKGAATFVASGCTVSPPVVAICIRANWTIGGVKDR